MPGRRTRPSERAARAYAQALARDGRRLSADEAHARANARLISRRDLLRAGGMLGAGLVASACLPFRSDAQTPRPSAPIAGDGPSVAVVGAGLAGLTAAYRLTQAGIAVRCFEARDRIGGRCFSSRVWADGQIAEHGGEFIDTRHVHLRGLARELGLPLDDLWDAWIDGSAWPYVVDGAVTEESHWNREEATVVDAITAAGRRIGVIGDSGASDDAYSYGTATRDGRAMDEMSMAEWLDVEVPGVSGSPLGRVLEARMIGWYGLGMSDLSAALWFDYYVLPDDGADERYTIRGGNDQVPALMADLLPAAALALEQPLEAMRRTSNGGYELRFTGSGEAVSADIVVMTVPFTALRDVDLEDAGFSQERLSAIRSQSMGQNTKLIFQLDAHPDAWRVGERVWSSGMQHVDGLFGSWESSGTDGGAASLITVYSGGAGAARFGVAIPHAEAPPELVRDVLAAMERAVPDLSAGYNGRAWLDDWPSDPWAHGSYAAFGPGQMSTLWGYNLLPEGDVHFAGEHTSTYSQGYLNGGVESGQRAAIEVMTKLGVAVPADIGSMPYSS